MNRHSRKRLISEIEKYLTFWAIGKGLDNG